MVSGLESLPRQRFNNWGLIPYLIKLCVSWLLICGFPVFYQSLKEKGNHQVLSVDEDKFNGDLEMMHILHRLITAASDSKLRQDMNVEDEFFSAIENRDTALMQKDKTIAE